MTPEKQRIAIAKFCGWTELTKAIHINVGFRGYANAFWKNEYGIPQERLPDYLNDLNAIHEAEAMLDKKQLQYTYAHLLYNVVTPKNIQPFRATADQRSEALLRTISRWEEDHEQWNRK